MLARLAKWSDSHEVTRRGRRWLLEDAPGVSQAVSALDRRRLQRLEGDGATGERAKRRWREASPEAGLAWGEQVSGEPAVEAADSYGLFGPEAIVVEIGPGYGRILSAALGRGVAFRRWIGVDLSEQNVQHLRGTFDDPRIEIVHGDAESVDVGEPIDSALSFLTFKHIYPSFQAALANLGGQLRPGGTIAFDLIEGSRRYFHRDNHTFMREYTRDEAAEIVGAAGLELVAIDEVVHAPGRTRMLIVARRPAA
jgi:SAM-dependent methyltransferase